jgi:hypothetical protein
MRLLANQGRAPKPRNPADNYISILSLKYI